MMRIDMIVQPPDLLEGLRLRRIIEELPGLTLRLHVVQGLEVVQSLPEDAGAGCYVPVDSVGADVLVTMQQRRSQFVLRQHLDAIVLGVGALMSLSEHGIALDSSHLAVRGAADGMLVAVLMSLGANDIARRRAVRRRRSPAEAGCTQRPVADRR